MATQAIIWDKSGRTTSGAIQQGTSAREVDIFLDPDQMRRPEYTVYLHSISRRSFEQPHPIYRNIIIPACPKDKRYFTFMKITHPVTIPTVNPDDPGGPNKLVFENAKRAALTVCNPSYVGTDLGVQRKAIDPQYQIASGECDLTRQGVFASMNEVPTEEELSYFEGRVLEYHKMRFEEANALERSDPKRLQEVLTLDHHMAAERFGIDVNWHRVVSPKVDCPNCGEKIKEGIAFHYSNGARCVLNWEKAYLAGAVKKEEVPEGKEWWVEERKIDKRTKEYRDSLKEIAE